MSNQSYEKLHKLVAFILRSGIISQVELSQILNSTLAEFQKEFEDEINKLGNEPSVN